MWSRLTSQTLLLQFLWLAGVAMFVPAIFAGVTGDFLSGRTFLYCGILTLILATLVTIATQDTPSARMGTLQQSLFAMFAALTILPLILAVPFSESLQTTSFTNAYLEMVSALTTTGLDLWEDPDRLPDALHLWRGMVAWFGGLMMWVAAVAVFAPLSLGGFEVTARSGFADHTRGTPAAAQIDPARRWKRSARMLSPIYAGLTFALWIMLTIMGDAPLAALIHAMSVMSTSGISQIGGVQYAGSGLGGELVIFLFLLFALSRQTFSADIGATSRDQIWQDPEFRFGMVVVFSIPLFLFLRHWFGAWEVDEEENIFAGLRALWGAIFTVLSFMTTTGFQSVDWQTSQSWSGLSTPGVLLMGLAVIGGGVATTAGGVKLLRVFALYLQGLREMERLVHPNSVSGSGRRDRRIRRKGAVIAWVFFMLFALSLTVVTFLLTFTGSGFEEAVLLAVSTLSTTGPLVQVAAENPVELLSMSFAGKLILCASMVTGRLETLVIIALLTPDLWRN